MALRCAAWMVALAVPVVVAVLYVFGGAHAVAVSYGVTVGLVSFVSTAVTVSLVTGRGKAAGVLLGVVSFGVRYGFAGVVLGVPAYLGLWPVVPMLLGFSGVYFAETMVLVPWSIRTMKIPAAPRAADEEVERRAGA